MDSYLKKLVAFFTCSKSNETEAKTNVVEPVGQSDRDAIAELVSKCAIEVATSIDDKKFNDILSEITRKLKEIFKSDYCAIGSIDQKYVIDRASTSSLPQNVKLAPIDSESCLVCKSLDYVYQKKDRHVIKRYEGNELKEAGNYETYQQKILRGKELKDTTVILIQDINGDAHGFLQFLNSEVKIDEDLYNPYKEDMLRLAFVVKQWYALKEAWLFKKDFDFINLISDHTNDVDSLLANIMSYLSKEFNAGIIFYRIPLFVGADRNPVFFLRDCYVKADVDNRDEIKRDYFSKRLIKEQDEIGGVEKLICKNTEVSVSLVNPKEKSPDCGNVSFKDKVIIIPILRDYSKKKTCINPNKKNKNKLCQDGNGCNERFRKYFGIFKLRIVKRDENDNIITEEELERLNNLAKHISALFNGRVDKNENESREKFQNELRESSFSDIRKFDDKCAEIIRKAIRSKQCAIYKFDKLANGFVLGASTASDVQITMEGKKRTLPFDTSLEKTLTTYRNVFPLEDTVVDTLFEKNEPFYYVVGNDCDVKSMMLVPMKKNDGTKIGVVLLIGKNEQTSDVSKTFWELDKYLIKFMVDILSRIEESDAERLVFLMRLAHELRRPLVEMVYLNDYLLRTLERDRWSFSKTELLEGLEENVRYCEMFKQIISDVETTYNMSKESIKCEFEDVDVKTLILDIIRLYEKGGWASKKRLLFKTYLSQMPETMNVDKQKIKQVFSNLVRNAIQYSDNGTIITVSYNFNDTDNCHEIDFQNVGIGISEADKDTIFDLWKRGETAKKLRPNGTGMGLSIVKEIMEAHNGKCYVKRLANPTIFTVSIPVEH